MNTRKLVIYNRKIKELEYTLDRINLADSTKDIKVEFGEVSIMTRRMYWNDRLKEDTTGYWYKTIKINPLFIKEAMIAQIQDLKSQIREAFTSEENEEGNIVETP